ncbi:NUDIX hydrolase [Hellea sp.]|jgi:8-oxo-dGTP pyrophosphatase MutT (NUDIX family)|nr:NUDIX hydrolase [Hellea sp.]MDA9047925.1 NUDIX hydrolase [Hellea sp.]
MDKHTRRSVQPRILETEPVKKFDGIAGAGVIILARDTGRCLFQLRNSDKRHKNTWGFWGGMIDNGESPFECIQRELKEEIGFVPALQKLNPIDIYQSKNKHFMYYSFVYVVDHEFVPTLNGESSGYAWVDIGKWPKPLHDGARSTLGRNKGTDKLRTILKLNL